MKIKVNILKKVFFGIMIICASAYAKSQDLHFSQYFNSPLLINPANTGFAPDADWRAGANYRNQWQGVLTNPYKTFGAWEIGRAHV